MKCSGPGSAGKTNCRSGICRSSVYTELVAFDGALAQRMSDRAAKVITATEAGELLPRSFTDQTHFECRMCAWQDRCWRTQP